MGVGFERPFGNSTREKSSPQTSESAQIAGENRVENPHTSMRIEPLRRREIDETPYQPSSRLGDAAESKMRR